MLPLAIGILLPLFAAAVPQFYLPPELVHEQWYQPADPLLYQAPLSYAPSLQLSSRSDGYSGGGYHGGGNSYGLSSIFKKFLPFRIHRVRDKDDEEKTTTSTTTRAPPPASFEDQCKNFNGYIVNNECYKLVDIPQAFDEAKMTCLTMKARLWTPHLDDIMLFNKIMTIMPKTAQVDVKALWYNARISDNKLIDGDGKDVTTKALVRMDMMESLFDGASSNCPTLSFGMGAFYTAGTICALQRSFICEMIPDEGTVLPHLRHPSYYSSSYYGVDGGGGYDGASHGGGGYGGINKFLKG